MFLAREEFLVMQLSRGFPCSRDKRILFDPKGFALVPKGLGPGVDFPFGARANPFGSNSKIL